MINSNNHQSMLRRFVTKQTILKEFVDTLPISEAAREDLVQFWNHKQSFKRGEFLALSGRIEPYLYLVLKGTFKIYYDLENSEAVVGFGYPPNLLLDYYSFIKEKPSPYYIQVLGEAEIIGIHFTDFKRLKDKHPTLEKLWHKLTEEALLGRIEREIDLITPSPKGRYDRLMRRSPHIFQLIPHKYIASYLRMTPETLSRMRKLSS